MKVLVCGGRTYTNLVVIFETLDSLHEKAEGGITLLIQGGAGGADELAKNWALERGVQVCTYHPNWAKHGKQAGPIRNTNMLRLGRPNLVVAFHGGKGTANLVDLAAKQGFEIKSIPK